MVGCGDWKPFGLWYNCPRGGYKEAYDSGAYWDGKSDYAIVLADWTKHCKNRKYYDVYIIPEKFKGKENMVFHLKNPIKEDFSKLKDAVEYIEKL